MSNQLFRLIIIVSLSAAWQLRCGGSKLSLKVEVWRLWTFGCRMQRSTGTTFKLQVGSRGGPPPARTTSGPRWCPQLWTRLRGLGHDLSSCPHLSLSSLPLSGESSHLLLPGNPSPSVFSGILNPPRPTALLLLVNGPAHLTCSLHSQSPPVGLSARLAALA
jgi:hypothetical protein